MALRSLPEFGMTMQPARPSCSIAAYPADAPMLLRNPEAGGFLRANQAFRLQVGVADEHLKEQPFVELIHPDDVPRVQQQLAVGAGVFRVRHATADGTYIELEAQVVSREDGQMVLARIPDAPDVVGAPEDEDDEATVSGTLHMIARIVEAQNPGYKCSILLVADGRFVRGAGPSLPEEYNAAIDGFAIGPAVGSCGTAIYWGVPVIVHDIQADPLWIPFRELAERAGVCACWSHPFSSKQGRVLGALALYSPEPRAPTREQLERLKAAAQLTGLAVERGRAEEALREQRKREAELQEKLRQAEKMEALGVMAGGVAHDFNNVLATILLNAEFARKRVARDAPVEDSLESIVAASRRAGDFCQQLLAYAGRGRCESAPFDLASTIEELRALAGASLSRVELSLSRPAGPVRVLGDEAQMLRVLMNLVKNSADAMPSGEGHIRVDVEAVELTERSLERLTAPETLSPGLFARVRVIDDGSGMGEATRERIFDPFFTTKLTGHGLGLSAVLGIVNQHDGLIDVKSMLGVGTTVSIFLPLAAEVARDDSAPRAAELSVRPRRVLLADDEAAFRSILAKTLRAEGYEVVEAADGQEAIDIFRNEPESFDCVLADLTMPRCTGDAVEAEVHRNAPDLPVILMSGYAQQEINARFDDDRIRGVLQKPVDTDTVLAAIRAALTACRASVP